MNENNSHDKQDYQPYPVLAYGKWERRLRVTYYITAIIAATFTIVTLWTALLI